MKNNKSKQCVAWARQIFILLLTVLSVNSLYGGKTMAADAMKAESITDVSNEKWKSLAEEKIFFGHHSVGNNIINGLLALQQQYPSIRMNIVRTHDAAQFSSPIFAHSAVGINGDPYSKIREFDEFIRDGIGAKADIVFFKFCFVDVVRKTDIRHLFEQYKSMVKQLQKDYPDLKIVHCTVPLQVHRLNWKSYLKNAMNFTSWKYTDNVRRNEFNAMLLKEYGGSGTVFDLALFEATRQDGGVVRFKGPGGKKFLALNPVYSSDGAHLNELGSKFVAEHLLLFLLQVM